MNIQLVIQPFLLKKKLIVINSSSTRTIENGVKMPYRLENKYDPWKYNNIIFIKKKNYEYTILVLRDYKFFLTNLTSINFHYIALHTHYTFSVCKYINRILFYVFKERCFVLYGKSSSFFEKKIIELNPQPWINFLTHVKMKVIMNFVMSAFCFNKRQFFSHGVISINSLP